MPTTDELNTRLSNIEIIVQRLVDERRLASLGGRGVRSQGDDAAYEAAAAALATLIEATDLPVPDVVGLHKDIAQLILQQAGFQVRLVYGIFPGVHTPEYVDATEPVADTVVDYGSLVIVTISPPPA
jgi:hypothetical protein